MPFWCSRDVQIATVEWREGLVFSEIQLQMVAFEHHNLVAQCHHGECFFEFVDAEGTQVVDILHDGVSFFSFYIDGVVDG